MEVGSNLKLAGLAYADDIVNINRNSEDAQNILDSLCRYALLIGLKINRSKTEYMTVPSDLEHNSILLDGQRINKADDFIYLGAKIFNSESDFVSRRAKAWVALRKVKKILSSHDEALKMRIFHSLIETVLLYGCESYAVSKSFARRVDQAHSALLRATLGVKWNDKITNNELYNSVKCLRGSQIVQNRRLRHFGHICRHPSEIVAGAILSTNASAKFRVGGHRRVTCYERTIENDVMMMQCNINDVTNRDLWREHINKLYMSLYPPD